MSTWARRHCSTRCRSAGSACTARRRAPRVQIEVAWVLRAKPRRWCDATQTYTALGNGLIRFVSDTFRTELSIDAEGYVTHYPGLADRV